jgi:hypothetical protein
VRADTRMRSSGVLELPGSSEFSTWSLPGPAWREGRRLRPPVGTSSVRITLARRRGYPAAAALAIALVLGACTSSGPGPAANRPPGGVSTRCSVTPPNAACATEVAGGLGFPFAWLSPPRGWTTGQPGHPGFVGRFGVASPVAEEVLHRGGVTVVLASGGMSEPPRVQTHRIFRWHGVMVREASGIPEPQPGAPWAVYYSWSMDGQPYRLVLFADPTQGPVGTLAGGRRTGERMLALVQFVSPAPSPSGIQQGTPATSAAVTLQ